VSVALHLHERPAEVPAALVGADARAPRSQGAPRPRSPVGRSNPTVKPERNSRMTQRRIRIHTDEHGAPVLNGDIPAKRERSHVFLGDLRKLPLVDDAGRTLGPAEALEVLLADGPLAAREFDALATRYDNPAVLYSAAEQIGAVRRANADGRLEIALPGREPDQETKDEITLADTGRREHPMSSDTSGLTPLREAQKLLGGPVIGGPLRIVKVDRNRYVNTSELQQHLARVGRGGKTAGAGEKIAAALGDATTRRAQTNREGQSNDLHRKRYGTARISGRD
jgi:hypothetical protein